MTKEAKLQAAVRILPEWVGYDEEIKALQLKIENENRQTEKEANGVWNTCILNTFLVKYVIVMSLFLLSLFRNIRIYRRLFETRGIIRRKK